MDDEDRDAILRRRNRFMSLALAGIATVGCGEEAAPVPCLEPTIIEPTPQPCLSPVNVPPVPNVDETSMGELGMEAVPPQPCLEPPLHQDPHEVVEGDPPEARPRPCLSRPRPSMENPDDLEVPTVPMARPRPCLSKVGPNFMDSIRLPPPTPQPKTGSEDEEA